MSELIRARVEERLVRLRLGAVAQRLDAILAQAARGEPTYLDFLDQLGEFYRDMGAWIASGAVTSRETVHDGIESMPDAFLGLFSGANTGKMLVRL